MRRCKYCKTLRFKSQLKRGAMFGNRICKNREACDRRKAASGR